MIQKTIIILLFSSILFSCGKKGDPKYIDSEKKVILQNIMIKKV